MSTESVVESVVPVVNSQTPTVTVPDLDVSELSNSRADVMLRSIAKNCVAVKVTVSAIGNERLVHGAQVSVGEHEIAPELLAGARFKIVPPGIRNSLNRIGQKARMVPYAYGTPFVGGAYLIPIARDRSGNSPAQKAFTTLSDVRREYREKAIELRPLWEAHVQKLQTDFPFEYEEIKQHLPNGEQFVNAHTISSIRFPLGAGLPANFEERLNEEFIKAFRGTPNEQTLNDHKEVILRAVNAAATDLGTVMSEAATETWMLEAQQQTSAAIANAVKAMVQEPLKEFAETLANVEGILARGNNLRRSTIDSVRASFEKLQGFSFMAPTELKNRLRAIGATIGSVEAKDINSSETASRELAGHFKNIREELTSEDTHSAVFGQFMRGLDL